MDSFCDAGEAVMQTMPVRPAPCLLPVFTGVPCRRLRRSGSYVAGQRGNAKSRRGYEVDAHASREHSQRGSRSASHAAGGHVSTQLSRRDWTELQALQVHPCLRGRSASEARAHAASVTLTIVPIAIVIVIPHLCKR